MASNPRLDQFIAASGLTNLADGIASLAWAWVASLMTRDPLWIAMVPVALRLPWFLCAIPAGIIADRVDRRRLILFTDVIRTLAHFGAAVIVLLALPLPEPALRGLTQPLLFGGLMLAALVVGVAEVFRDNAAQTMLPALVDKPGLERANGRLWSVELTTNQLIGPALGAVLLGWWLPAPFAVNAAALGLAVLLVLGLKGSFSPPERARAPWRFELAEAWAYLRSDRLLGVLAVVTGLWNLTFQMVLIALILFLQERLGQPAYAYGIILGAGAIGGVLAGFAAGGIVARIGPARAALWSLPITPLVYAAFALAPWVWALALAMAIFNFAGIVWNTVSVSYRQRSVPNGLMGRVNSIYRLLAWGMMPVGMLLSGLSVRWAEGLVGRESALAAPFWLAAAISVLLIAFGWRPLARGFAARG